MENPYMTLAERVGRHSVCFARERDNDALISGSGTLARYGRVQGIASCAHVIDHITNTAGYGPSDKIAIIRKTASDGLVQRPVVALSELAVCPSIRCGNQDEREGPDLAFLCLSNKIMRELGESRFVLNLDEQRELHGKPWPVDATDLMHVAVGSVAEWKEKPVSTIAGPLVTNATVFLPGHYSEQKANGIDDRFCFEPDGMTKYPTTFGGMSGGGLWRVCFKGDPARSLELIEQRLVGITYYQTRDGAGDEGTPFHLIGHGPSSIYEWLLPKLTELEARLASDATSPWLALP